MFEQVLSKDWQSQQTVFEQLAASELAIFNLTGSGEPERIAAASVTANLTSLLGVAPVIGRGFLPEEEQPGHSHVVLLSHGMWQRRFGGDPLLNKVVQLNGEGYTVVGVMPFGFQFPGARGLWVPLTLDPSREPWRAVTPHYFRTMGIPLLQGREFDEGSSADKPLRLIVSESFARRYWPNKYPIGMRFRPGTNNPVGTVIGVVGDVRNSNLNEEAQPAFYFPYDYIGMPGPVLVVRTNSNPESLAAALRAQAREIDTEQPVYNVRTMAQIMSNVTTQPRFQTVLLGLFSVVAVLLAAVGIYSVMSYLVRQRRREIGIRMALGATAHDILRMVIRQGMRQVLLGIVLGLAGSFAATRLMKSLFFEVSATDPLTFILVTLLLAGVALVACYLPAWYATKVNPLTVLRHE